MDIYTNPVLEFLNKWLVDLHKRNAIIKIFEKRLTYIFKREFVELSVAYKMSSYILEKYKPVISGQSKT